MTEIYRDNKDNQDDRNNKDNCGNSACDRTPAGTRINKYLSEAGVCSRREADRLLEAGEVRINGAVAEKGARVGPGDLVVVKGRPVELEEPAILLAFHKPRGIVCTASQKEKQNIVDYLSYPRRVYPVGRLDKDSRGLIFMTNQGDLVNKMMRAGNCHEKEYLVTVREAIDPQFIRSMAGGVPILGTVTRKCQVEQMEKRRFRIVLTQGLNRQIRRMCDYFGYHVTDLLRVRIMNIRLEGLGEGEYRELSEQEIRELHELTRDSYNQYGEKG